MTDDLALFAAPDECGPAPRAAGCRPYLIVVHGKPETQGNSSSFAIRRKGADGQVQFTGKIGRREGRSPEAEARFHSWRNDVAAAAEAVMDGAPPIDGPVGIRVTFTLARPSAHYGTGKNAGILKQSAWLMYPTGPRPDRDKLERAVGDSLQAAGVYLNDGQVVASFGFKTYVVPNAAPPGPEPGWVMPPVPGLDTMRTPGAVIRVWEII